MNFMNPSSLFFNWSLFHLLSLSICSSIVHYSIFLIYLLFLFSFLCSFHILNVLFSETLIPRLTKSSESTYLFSLYITIFIIIIIIICYFLHLLSPIFFFSFLTSHFFIYQKLHSSFLTLITFSEQRFLLNYSPRNISKYSFLLIYIDISICRILLNYPSRDISIYRFL